MKLAAAIFLHLALLARCSLKVIAPEWLQFNIEVSPSRLFLGKQTLEGSLFNVTLLVAHRDICGEGNAARYTGALILLEIGWLASDSEVNLIDCGIASSEELVATAEKNGAVGVLTTLTAGFQYSQTIDSGTDPSADFYLLETTPAGAEKLIGLIDLIRRDEAAAVDYRATIYELVASHF